MNRCKNQNYDKIALWCWKALIRLIEMLMTGKWRRKADSFVILKWLPLDQQIWREEGNISILQFTAEAAVRCVPAAVKVHTWLAVTSVILLPPDWALACHSFSLAVWMRWGKYSGVLQTSYFVWPNRNWRVRLLCVHTKLPCMESDPWPITVSTVESDGQWFSRLQYRVVYIILPFSLLATL